MKLSISNIAWSKDIDIDVYAYLVKRGYSAIEIAPLRTIDAGYDASDKEIELWSEVYQSYFDEIASMQSLLFKMQESIFATESNMLHVLAVLKKGVIFAAKLKVRNLVFGSPTLRTVNDEIQFERSKQFFIQLADFADDYGISIALEPNPTIYNTNFINTTQAAFDYVQMINHQNLGINLDLGTVIENKESIHDMINSRSVSWIKHVHVSEPYLMPIDTNRYDFHVDVLQHLKSLNYEYYVSIEMKSGLSKEELFCIIDYIRKIGIEAGVVNEK